MASEPTRSSLVPEVEGGLAMQIYAGERLFAEQWIGHKLVPPLTVTARVESSHNPICQVNATLCHKTLLQSFDCVGGVLVPQVTADGRVMHGTELLAVPSQLIPADAPDFRDWCPVSLAFSVAGERGGWVKISDVNVVDATGASVIRNGDFEQGSQYWCFTCDDHLVWRAKNIWVHLVVEMGWLGAVAFSWLTLGTVALIVRAAWSGFDWSAAVTAWSLAGFLAMGVFGTLIDVPWLMTLFLFLVAFAQGLGSLTHEEVAEAS